MNWIKRLFTKKITTQEEFMAMFKKKLLSGTMGKGEYSGKVLAEARKRLEKKREEKLIKLFKDEL